MHDTAPMNSVFVVDDAVMVVCVQFVGAYHGPVQLVIAVARSAHGQFTVSSLRRPRRLVLLNVNERRDGEPLCVDVDSSS